MSTTGTTPTPGALAALLRRATLRTFERLEEGELELVEGGDARRFGHASGPDPLRARVVVRDPGFWVDLVLRGALGAGEAFMAGRFECDDLVALVRLFARNRDAALAVESGLARLAKPLLRLWHASRRNTRDGARRNIADHYDLGNDFFALFLDETMTYSCGIHESAATPLREASIAKIDRLCRRLQLKRGERLLEIGSGWGALAIHAAREYGARVTTTTISREQHRLATERVRAAGLCSQVDVVLEDYRDLRGRFDKLVSVEMVEAIGWRRYPDYFAAIARLLEPWGAAAIQAIVIADQHYDAARRSVDFIQRHIFPGSCIPSTTALLDAATRASDLRLVALDDLTPHYALTLRAWRERFLAQRDALAALGFDDVRRRAWEWYFAYCEGGFAERVIGDVQLRFDKPRCREAPLLPALPPPASASASA